MGKVIIIYGPTAVGKSAVGIRLAKLLNGEIISADSMQIYKGLDIGSAKVTTEEMQGIAHHLINIKKPDQEYSVADYCIDAKQKIDEILAKGKTPIIVGGTGLYIKALIEGYNFGNVGKQNNFRLEAEKLSNAQIYEKILEIDKDAKVDINNKHRLIRLYEKLVFGEELASNGFCYDYMLFGICDDREKIYERINSRVNKMINEGLLDELKYLLSLNLSKNSLCMKAIGYKELIPYIKGEDTLENCIAILQQKTRNYAKRQFTFMNQFKNMVKINFCGTDETAQFIFEYLNQK